MNFLFKRRIQIYIAAGAFLFFILIALDILYKGQLFQLDGIINQWSKTWHTPLFDKLFYAITQLGNLSTMLVYLILLTLFFWWKKEKVSFVFMWVSMIGGAALFSLIKQLFKRSRPSSYIGDFHQHGYSFPSGHATMSMIFALMVFFIFYPRSNAKQRIWLAAFTVLFPILIAFSRVYLGVHYFTDVSAGLVLGIFWMMLCALYYDSHKLLSQNTKAL